MKWVSVKKRLPKDDANVLVLDAGDCTEAYCEDGVWYSAQHGLLRDVTHWMPRPMDPEEAA